jgi:hypothetical protein
LAVVVLVAGARVVVEEILAAGEGVLDADDPPPLEEELAAGDGVRGDVEEGEGPSLDVELLLLLPPLSLLLPLPLLLPELEEELLLPGCGDGDVDGVDGPEGAGLLPLDEGTGHLILPVLHL